MMGFGSGATHIENSTGFRADATRSGTHTAKDWANFPPQVQQFCERLQGVVIEKESATDVIKRHDHSDTLHYVDPPYLKSTRSTSGVYSHEMGEAEHRELASVLHQTDGMVLLSGYDSRLYRRLYEGWKKVTRSTTANGQQGAVDRTEALWLSPDAHSHQTLFQNE